MLYFILVAFAITCVGTALLGARLVFAGLRTRTAPELCYGLGLLMTGASSALRILIFGILGGKPEHHSWVVAAALCAAVSLVALATGVRVIFRPEQRWPKLLVGVFACAACATIAISVSGEVTSNRPLLQRPNELAMLACMIWGAIECWLHFAKMRRRLALGLADPLITSQFALWGTSFSLATIASGLYLFVPLMTGVSLLESPLLALSVQGLMVAVTIGTWLAFYPPNIYRRYIVGSPSE